MVIPETAVFNLSALVAKHQFKLINNTQPTPHYHMVINGNFRKINADLVQFNN